MLSTFFRTAILVAALSPPCAFAQASSDSGSERLRIHGSNLLGERIVPAMVDGWLREIGYTGVTHKRVNGHRLEIHAVRDEAPLIVEIDTQGSASGLADLVEGNAEIAMSAREPTAKELDDAWQLGDLHSPEQEWVVGLNGLAALVAPGNRVQALSAAQLRDVMSGRIADWAQLGGAPAPIHVYALAEGNGVDELGQSLVMKDARLATTARRFARQSELLDALGQDAGGIGLVGMRAPRGRLHALAIRAGADAYLPERLAASAEDYPLQRRAYFYTGQLITALGRGFVLYAMSPAGQRIVERSPLLSLDLRPLPQRASGQATAEYRQLTADARRLSMTIRFGRGLDLLDSRSRQDLERLNAYLHRPENAQRRLMLLGFANPDPKAPLQALTLSHERVDYLASELLAQGMKVLNVRGFGGSRNLVPVDQPDSRYRNERVEIWVR